MKTLYLISLVLLCQTLCFNGNAQAKVFWAEGNLLHFYSINEDSTDMQLLYVDTIDSPENIFVYESKIYFNDKNTLKTVNKDGSNYKTLLVRESIITSLVIDTKAERIYWVEVGKSIYSSNLDGSDTQFLYKFSGQGGSVRSIAVDESNGLIYFANNNGIFRIKKNLQSDVQIIEDGLEIHKLRIDSDDKKLFWIDKRKNEVYRSSIDGTDIKVLSNILFARSPKDIFLDKEKGLVHILDIKGFNIKSVNYFGSPRQDLMSLGNGNSVIARYSIFYDFGENELFWSAISSNPFIKSKGKNDSSSKIVLQDSTSEITDVAIDPNQGRIYLTEKGILSMDIDGSNRQQLIDVDDDIFYAQVDNQKIYYFDESQMLKRADLDGSNIEMVLDTVFSSIPSIDVDADIMFSADVSSGFVKKVSLNTGKVKSLYDGAVVNKINFDNGNNSLFWIEMKPTFRRIMASDSMGNNLRTIYTTPNFISDIALDKAFEKVYWLEYLEGVGGIYSADYDGSNIKKIHSVRNVPLHIEVLSIFDFDQDGYLSDEDCDDTNALINPGQQEVPYNGIDDDCDPMTLDDDIDQDGYVLSEDCDDTNALVHPGQQEVPYNGIDDDCDPMTLDDDLDQDGYELSKDCDDTNALINPGQQEIPYNGIDEDCDPMTLDDDIDQDGYVLSEDCDDTNALINPGQQEIPYNGIDEDCDPMTLDDDLDQDGYVLSEDCDDTNALINPGQQEVPYNGIDDDCDPMTLDDDIDQDGYVLSEDCDDTNALINPGQQEVPYNGIDDDCDPVTLDDDLDQDGYLGDVDCNDDNPNIYPGAEEIPNNGIDEDCDGSDATTSTYEWGYSTVKIYPNPASEFITIDVSHPMNYWVALYDINGREIHRAKNIKQLFVDSFSPGIYVLELSDIASGNRILNRMMIKRK